MRGVLAVLGVFAAVAAHGETETSTQAKTESTAPAYLREDAGSARQSLEPVAEALPAKLNADFANESAKTDLSPEEVSETDLVLQKEQQNWLTVGVQKLSGDYEPEAELSADEEDELADKRQSFKSPTLFVDHYARLQQARVASAGTEKPELDLQFDYAPMPVGNEMDFYTGWREPLPPEPMSRQAASRENPYLRSLNLQPASTSNNVYMAVPTWTETPTTRVPEARSPMAAPERERPLSQPAGPSVLTVPGLIATPAAQPAPASAPVNPLREQNERQEKYFRNLDRF